MKHHLYFLLPGLLLTSAMRAQTLNAPEFRKAIVDSAAVVIDVRTASEFESGHIAGAMNLNVEDGQFAEQAALLDKTRGYYLYCGAGVRSAKAAKILGELGFAKVFDLADGLDAWMEKGYPVVTGNK